jgi:hypothetical protein
MKLEFSHQIFKKPSDVIFQENLSSGSQDVPCRPEKHMDGHEKLIVAFHHFMSEPNNSMCLLNRATNWRLVKRNNVITMMLTSVFVT